MIEIIFINHVLSMPSSGLDEGIGIGEMFFYIWNFCRDISFCSKITLG
ncbi:MAG: hypothetical protein H7281_07445 [Bacteriovorax sp.]|nr:hypothetical protein [Bacteriovorax sp.]